MNADGSKARKLQEELGLVEAHLVELKQRATKATKNAIQRRDDRLKDHILKEHLS